MPLDLQPVLDLEPLDEERPREDQPLFTPPPPESRSLSDLPSDPNDPNFNPGLPPRLTNEEWDRLKKASELRAEQADVAAGGELIARGEDVFDKGLVSPRAIENLMAVGAPAVAATPGVAKSIAQNVSGLTTPVNLAIGAGAAATGGLPLVTRGIAGGFAADIASHMPELGTAAGSAETPEEKQKAYADIALSSVMGGLAGAGAVARPAPIPPKILQTIVEHGETLPKAAAAVVKKVTKEQPKEVPSASSIESPTALHGDVRPLEKPAEVLPVAESGAGIQPREEPPGARQPARAQGGSETEVLLKRIETMPDAEAAKLNQRGEQYEGLNLTPADVPALEAARKASGEKLPALFEKAAQTDAPPDVQLAAQAEYGRSIWLSGAIETANKKGPNYELSQRLAAEKAAAQPAPVEPARVAGVPAEVPAAEVSKQTGTDITSKLIEEMDVHQYPETRKVAQAAPAKMMSATEKAVLDKLPSELSIGKYSKPLLFSPKLPKLSKPEHAALIKLVRRGDLRVMEVGNDYVLQKAPVAEVPPAAPIDIAPTKALSVEQKAFNATTEGQKTMSARASRIATLRQLNEAIRKVDPKEAYDQKLIDNTPDSQIDTMLESLRQDYNRLIKPNAPEAVTPEPAVGSAAGRPEVAVPEAATYAQGAKAIADRLREQFKTETGGKTFTGPVEIINAAVEVAAKIIEYGGSAADAIAAAVKHIRENFKGDWDEAAFRKQIEEAIKVPETAGENVKMRKSAERATEAPAIPEPVRERIAEAPESRYTQQSMARVEEAVATLPDAELAQVPRDSDLYTAARLEQAKRLFDAGKNEEGYQVFVELEKEGTRLGQLINQFKLLESSKPEQIVAVINKQLEKAGKDILNPAQTATALDIARRAKAADGELKTATSEWEKSPTGQNAARAEAALDASNGAAVELQQFVAKFQPRSTASILKSVLQGNLLTPISEVANLVGNMSFLPFRAAGRTAATGLDIVNAYIRDVPRTRTVQPIAGTIEAAKGAARGLAKVPSILVEGGNVIKGETRAGLHPVKAWINQFSKNPEMPTTGGKLTLKDRVNLAIEGTFGIPAETMLRGLGAGDAPFKEAARARVTAEQLRLADVPREQWEFAQKFPELFLDKKALDQIHRDTMSAVFQGESKALNYITNLAKSRGEMVDLLWATVAPYKLTPWNIVSEILSYNPLIAMARGVAEAKKGNTRAAVDAGGKFIVGSLLTGAGIWLYKRGLLAPSLDERTEAQKARILSGQVLPPNHINISGLKRAMSGGDPAFQPGDETRDVFRAGGLAGSIFYMTANIGRDLERGPKVEDTDMWMSILRQSTLEQARFGLNQSFLSGVEGLLTAVKEGSADNFLRQWMNTVASIPLPNTLNTINRAARLYQPDMKAKDFGGTIENMFRNKTGLTEYLPLRRDLWGEPMRETPEGRDALAYHFFDITKGKQVTDDPVALELYRLWRKTSDNKVIPSIPERSMTVAKTTYALDPQQYERYAELAGRNRRHIVDALVINPQYQRLTEEQKLKLLDRAYDSGLERAKATVFGEMRQQLTPKAQRAGFTP